MVLIDNKVSRYSAHFIFEMKPPRRQSLFVFIYLFKIFIYLFIYFWLHWVFAAACRLSPVAASGGHSSLRCLGFSPWWPLPARSRGCRHGGSAAAAHRLSCSAARGILPDQGLNPCPLHWQADSQPLRHQRSPSAHFKIEQIADRIEGVIFTFCSNSKHKTMKKKFMLFCLLCF